MIVTKRHLVWVGVLGLSTLCGCATNGGGGPALSGRKGTPWTIQCLELQGPNRWAQIEQVAEALKSTPGLSGKDVFVREDSDAVSRLFYGIYHRRVDSKTGRHTTPARLRRDLDYIRGLSMPSGERMFLRALPVRMPTPDVGNPGWALGTVPATYSLQVGVFEPSGDFWEYKQAAVDFCAMLRDKGFEAYYHHGGASSEVTVGAFGPDAVIRKWEGDRWATYYSPAVLALQSNDLLKYNRLNGAIYRVKSGAGPGVPMPSRVVKIPHELEGGR